MLATLTNSLNGSITDVQLNRLELIATLLSFIRKNYVKLEAQR